MGLRREGNDRTVSMPGVLLILFGGCFIFSYNKFHALQMNIPRETGAKLTILASLLVLLGLWLVLSNYFRLPRIPWPGRFRRSKKKIVSFPRQGIVYLVILQVMILGALLGRANMLFLIFSLMAGAFVVNGGTIYTMLQRLKVKRIFPEAVAAGQNFTVQVALTNQKKIISSRMMEVKDSFSDGNHSYVAGTVFAYVPPGSTEYASYQLRLNKRGVYQFGAIKITSRFPLGIVERGVVIDQPGEIRVYPRIGRLSLSWKNLMNADQEILHLGNLRKRVHEDEFHRIREFREGDNPRMIHWTSTAKQAEVMVREFHENRESNMDVILDLCSVNRKNPKEKLRIELAISFVASVLHEMFNESTEIRFKIFVMGDKPFFWEGHPSPQNLKKILSYLSEADACTTEQANKDFDKHKSDISFNEHVLLVTTRKKGSPEWDGICEELKDAVHFSGSRLISLEADPEKMDQYFSLPPI